MLLPSLHEAGNDRLLSDRSWHFTHTDRASQDLKLPLCLRLRMQSDGENFADRERRESRCKLDDYKVNDQSDILFLIANRGVHAKGKLAADTGCVSVMKPGICLPLEWPCMATTAFFSFFYHRAQWCLCAAESSWQSRKARLCPCGPDFKSYSPDQREHP